MTTPTPRHERRRLLRAMAKNGPPVEVVAAMQRSQIPLALAMSGFVLASMAMAIVLGANMWVGGFSWFFVLGWLGIGGIYALSFGGWLRWKNRFVWRKRWYALIFLILTLGLGGGVIWAGWFEDLGQHSLYSKTLNDHKDVVEFSERWTQGSSWNAATCLAQRSKQEALMEDVLRGENAPNPAQINLAMAVEKVFYQAGCDHQWKQFDQVRRAPPARWESNAPYRTTRMLQAWTLLWPKIGEGCLLDAQRSEALGLKREAAVIQNECAVLHPSDERLWVPDVILEAAREWVKRSIKPGATPEKKSAEK